MANKNIYRINFLNEGQVYEIYGKKILQSELFGFIEVEELIFNTRTSVVVDPAEERLKNEFAEVKRTYIPLHSVIRIDEVKKEGIAKIHAPQFEITGSQSTVKPFPTTFQKPPSKN